MPAFRRLFDNLFKAFRSPKPIRRPRSESTDSAFLHPQPPPSSDKRKRRRPKRFDPGVEKTENGGDIMGSSVRGKGQSRSDHVCESFGYRHRWLPTCGEVGGTKRRTTRTADRKVVRSSLPKVATPIKLTDVYNRLDNKLNWRRIPLPGIFGAEVERVVGGGLIPGSLVLVGGDPGVGKSTLLLQSVEQIGSRADRLSIETQELFLYSSTDIEDILEKAQHLSPWALVIDSIQTVYLRGVTGSPDGISQVRECTKALNRFAKETNIPVILIGHVTKAGEIAGPRSLQHIVDVVLYMEREKSSSHRLVQPRKNRFGSTDELGVFKMSESGLRGVSNPSEIFLVEQYFDSDFPLGLAVAVVMVRSRAFLIEIQALCGPGMIFERNVDGCKASRLNKIISIIRMQTGLPLDDGVFLNVVGEYSLREREVGIYFLEQPIPNGIVFIAEVGLGGELRQVPQLEKRLNTVPNMGYNKCIVPKFRDKSFADLLQPGSMEISECKNLKEVIKVVFGRSSQLSSSLPTHFFLQP